MVSLNVNGVDQQFDGDPNMPLLWYVRDELGLTGSKYGCGAGLCGACTVHLDGEAVRSCMTAVGDAEGQQVVTIEGLSPDGNHPVQVAWREINVPQCGFCQTGQIMQAAGLLAAEADALGRRDPRGDGRQRLPMRVLRADRRRGPSGCHGSMIRCCTI